MRTTIDLPDETFRKLKAEAALRGFKLKELVAQFIERGLAEGPAQPAPARQRSPLPVAIAREPGTPLTSALTNAQLYAILDEEDIAEYRRVLNRIGPAPMMDLPDINVWLALADENHIHHASASRYWHEPLEQQAAFCRVTMLGLLRLSTQPRILSRTLTHEEAWGIYRQYLANPAVCFLAEPASIEAQFATLSLTGTLPHRLWTDAYLAAFAVTAGCRLVSFDSDFQRFPALNFQHLVPLPPG